MKTPHEHIILEGFFPQAAVTFSAEILIEMSYWPKSIEMTVDSHVGVTLVHQSGSLLQEEGSRPIRITNKNKFASRSLHILNALQI